MHHTPYIHTHSSSNSSALWTVVVTCVRWCTVTVTVTVLRRVHSQHGIRTTHTMGLTDRDGPNDQYVAVPFCSLQQCGHVRITCTHTAVTQACYPSPSRTCAHLRSHTKSKRQASWLLKRGFALQTALHPLCRTAEAPLNASSSMSSPQKLPPPPLSMGQNILAGAFAGMSELCCM
jgi:hypothetical protein